MPLPTLDAVLGTSPATAGPGNRIGIITGEGIGSEITHSAVRVIEAINTTTDQPIRVEFGPDVQRAPHGDPPVTEALHDWFEHARASRLPVLHGPAGGRYVYDLRKTFNLFVKLTPVQTNPALVDASMLRPERVHGTDLLLVRDNSAGLYQGEFGWSDERSRAFHTLSYTRDQITAVMEVAVRVAAQRNGRLTVVTKPGGVPTVSELWRTVAETVNDGRVELNMLEIDNACYQLGSRPAQFDVVVSPNMFGDVLGDTAAIALGSRGLSYSANFAHDGFSVYQTAHGAAHDLAGTNTANPIAHLSSLAWLLEGALTRPDLAGRVRSAIDRVLLAGIRTADIAGPESLVVGTTELTDAILEALTADDQ